METASLAVLEYASKYKESLLFDRYKAGVDQIARGRKEPPYAYVIPAQQRDPVAAVELLRRLAFAGVRVAQLSTPATVEGRTYPAGTWVVPTDQEFAAMAREVLDVQHYPDLRQYPGGPPERPYDAAGWTLPIAMGIDVTAISAAPLPYSIRSSMKWLGSPIDFNAHPTPYNLTDAADSAPFDSVPGIGFNTSAAAAAIVPPAGRVTGSGSILSVDPAQNNAFRAINHAWKQGATIEFADGRYAIAGLPLTAQDDLVRTLALQAARTDASSLASLGARRAVKKPRVGLYEPWTGSMDEGWTRWLLEQYGFSFVTLHPEDFHAPLGAKVDVILIADDARVPIAGAPANGRGGQRGPVRPSTPMR